MKAWAVAAVVGWLFSIVCIWAVCASRRLAESERQVRLHSAAADLLLAGWKKDWIERGGG